MDVSADLLPQIEQCAPLQRRIAFRKLAHLLVDQLMGEVMEVGHSVDFGGVAVNGVDFVPQAVLSMGADGAGSGFIKS